MSITHLIPADPLSAKQAQAIRADPRWNDAPEWFQDLFSLVLDAVGNSKDVLITASGKGTALTPAQAGAALGLSRSAVSRLVKEGRLPATRVGNRLRIRAEDVYEFRRKDIEQKINGLRALTDNDLDTGLSDIGVDEFAATIKGLRSKQ